MKKVRVVFATPSLGSGGREKVLSTLINYFSHKSELDVHVILYGKKREIFFELDKSVHIHEPHFEFGRISIIGILKTLLFLRLKIKKLAPDKIISFEEKWNRFLLLASVGMKLNIYLSNRNHPNREYGTLDKFLARKLYPKAKVLIAQTQIAKDIYLKKYRLQKCIVIGNPIEEIKSFDEDLRSETILAIGRLMDTKNHDRLIRIFNDLRTTGWNLVIVGGDFANQKISKKLKEIIKDLGIEDKVFIVGHHKNVLPYLLSSKIFAFTSDREGFPNVIGEAMSAGLPVVSYNCLAGPSEMINDRFNGFLVPVFDDALFKRRLLELIGNEKLRIEMGTRAKSDIKRFNSKIICEKFHDVIFS